MTVVAYPDGLASIVSAARQRARRLDGDDFDKARRVLDDAERNTARQLGAAFWVLGGRRVEGQIVWRSLADWLVPYLLRDVLRLNVIGGFKHQDLRRLSNLEDTVAREWVAMRAEPNKNYASAIAETTGLSDQTVYNRRDKWLREYEVDIAIPRQVYVDLLALGSLSAAQSEQRAALLVADTGADAEATVRALTKAFAEFDRRRSTIGEIADARPRQVKVVKVDPSVEAKLLWEGHERSTRTGHGFGHRDPEPGSGSSKRATIQPRRTRPGGP